MSAKPPNEALADLASLLGDDATREIVKLFLSDFPESVGGLASCSKDDQLRIVHGLKNSALHMGAAQLSSQMAGLEERLNKGGEPVSFDEVAEATGRFDSFAAALRQYADG